MRIEDFRPAGRLVPVFSAHDGLASASLVLALSKAAAARGETVLMLDVMDGALLAEAGIIARVNLGDVLYCGADIKDAKYISNNEDFTVANAGDANLDALLGSMAALSLGYDWVFVGAPMGCTPAHIRLAGASDASLLSYASARDQFMRAYWMLDVVRACSPKFDPLMIVDGSKKAGTEEVVSEEECLETYDLFAGTVRDFLGAPPALGGIIFQKQDAVAIAPALLEALRAETKDTHRKISA
ncbi:MAG: hypothetical protein V3U57_03095 [Robiginitomaculum sp.]